MRAARICFPFVGNLVGGSHISSCGLIRQLDRARFEPQILLQHPTGPIAELLSDAGIGFERAPRTPELEHGRSVGRATAFRLLAHVPALARLLRRRKIDIVHCNDGRSLATWALPARLAGAKLLWHHRGSPRSHGLRWLAPLLADRVIAVSRFAAPQPSLYSAARRTHVIHSPFDTDMAHDREAARNVLMATVANSRSETRFIAFSGALIARKRPLLFVEAIAALRRRMPGSDVRGVLLGESLDGMEHQVSAKARELGIGNFIHILGFRTPGPFWLAGCDLLMVPAVDEPFGRTLIEAMLVGTPVVATASGGNVEAIDDGRTGRLVPPEDADMLAAACRSLLIDPQLACAVAAAAKAEACSRYGETAHAEAVMAVYADLLSARGQFGPAAGAGFPNLNSGHVP